jgi:hypothetical protein
VRWLEAAYGWAVGPGFVWLVLAAWVLAGGMALLEYLKRRHEGMSDHPGSVPGASAGDRPHNPGKDTTP